jgi:hypothetical protein
MSCLNPAHAAAITDNTNNSSAAVAVNAITASLQPAPASLSPPPGHLSPFIQLYLDGLQALVAQWLQTPALLLVLLLVLLLDLISISGHCCRPVTAAAAAAAAAAED